MIEDKEAEEKKALRKSQSRPQSCAKDERDNESKYLNHKSAMETVSKYLNPTQAVQPRPREQRNSSKSKERPNSSFVDHAGQLESHLKKSLGGTGDSSNVLFEIHTKASREQFRAGASADPLDKPAGHINIYHQDPRAPKPEARITSHSKKLLNSSGDRTNPLRVSEEKDSKAKLANKEK